ncbi:MAG: TRAP transporter TatT component family protein [Deltaproteobacteria bacterium]|nr:TRAP transporter TatT component family protein [Deltaproteobacteria bacterium]
MWLSVTWLWIFLFSFLLSLQSACLPRKKATIVAAASVLEEVAKSSYKQTDLRMIREGMPAYLMLMDGMIEAWPDNERLLISAAQGYSSFASAFMEDQDRDYARLLYGKGKEYALRALEGRGLKEPLHRPFDDFSEALKDLGQKDVPYIFWAAACWGSWISLSLHSMEALAELPRVKLMMERVLELDEGFYYGGAHLFMGIWFASRPQMYGGGLEKARQHFLKAVDLGRGKFLMAYVYYADHYARRFLDKDLFISTLNKVLDAPVDISPELTLLNAVAKKRAKELLTHANEYFE